MVSALPSPLTPRKTPRQARAVVTLDAVFEATIQVLVAEGAHRLTTTRVAQRAGVSVGTMYQYFPNKQSLFHALNERYLDGLAQRLEAACQAQHGATIKEMIEAFVTTYWTAKTERAEATRALYRSMAELDNKALIDAFAARIDSATSAMLASASDARFTDLATVDSTLLATIFGTVRAVFERDLPTRYGRVVLDQLIVMCNAYLEEIRLKS